MKVVFIAIYVYTLLIILSKIHEVVALVIYHFISVLFYCQILLWFIEILSNSLLQLSIYSLLLYSVCMATQFFNTVNLKYLSKQDNYWYQVMHERNTDIWLTYVKFTILFSILISYLKHPYDCCLLLKEQFIFQTRQKSVPCVNRDCYYIYLDFSFSKTHISPNKKTTRRSIFF